MNTQELTSKLVSKHIQAKHYDPKSRIYLDSDDKKFTKYIQGSEVAPMSIRIYLKEKEFGEKYSKAEWKTCFEKRDELVAKLNDLNLGITFDKDGNETSDNSEDISDEDILQFLG